MGVIATAASGLGTIVNTVGSFVSGQAQAGASKYNAEIAGFNAQQAKRNADLATQAGSAQAGIESEKTRAQLGSIRANEGASGVDVNSGSAEQTQGSTRELGQLDALQIRANATKEAYGYETQSENFKAQQGLDKSEASADLTAGYLNSASTLIGGAGKTASNYAKYQQAGGFSG